MHNTHSRFVMKVITFFPAFEGVCLALIDRCQARYEDLSSRPGAATVAPSTCAGSSLGRKIVHSSPTTTGSTIAAPQGRKRMRSSTGARVTAADTSISPGRNSGVLDYGTCEKGASEAKVSEVVVSKVDPLLARISLLCKMPTVLRRYRVLCLRVGRRRSSVS